ADVGRPIDPVYAEFGRRVRRRRDALGWSQDRLAKLLHPPMTRASIANIESAQQRVLLHTALELAAALEVPLAELAGDAAPLLPDTDTLAAELASKLTIPSERARSLASRISTKSRSEKP